MHALIKGCTQLTWFILTWRAALDEMNTPISTLDGKGQALVVKHLANHHALRVLIANSLLRLPRPRELHHLSLWPRLLPRLKELLLLEMLLTLHP